MERPILMRVKRTHPSLLADMAVHYSAPKGFVGRNICYVVAYGERTYGHIVGGSATLHLAGRDGFFGLTSGTKRNALGRIINNIFFHVEPRGDSYPFRNFTQKVLAQFRAVVATDWEEKYGVIPVGFESLVELPRNGEVYRRDGWQEVGLTHGFTCKRVAGHGTDSWTGKRVWDVKNLRPKRVFCRRMEG